MNDAVLVSGGIEHGHTEDRGVLAHHLARVDFDATAVAYDHDAPAKREHVEIAVEIDVRQHFKHEIDAAAHSSLAELIAQSSARFRDLAAFSSMGEALTYAALEGKSRDFAAYLQQQCGLVKGDRLAIMMPNLLQYPVALFGAFRAGLVVVNCNPLYTGRELEHQLKDSGARAIVVLENFAHTVQEVVGRTAVETVFTTEIGDLFPPVKRLLTNLIENALRYGGQEVRVEARLAGDPGAPFVLLSVQDRGPGLAEHELSDIFNPFIRGDRARGGTGTGLGLAIVKRIAALHGGHVELRNREGGGLEARVCLPLGLLLPREAG